MTVVHLPKITLLHGHLVVPRTVPVWLPLALATTTLVVVAALVNSGIALMSGSAAPAYAPVTAQVMTYVNEWNPQRDPLVTLPGGVQAKSTNVYGVEVGDVRYYYQMTQSSSFDPLRSGKVSAYEVIAVVDAGTPWEVLVYRLR